MIFYEMEKGKVPKNVRMKNERCEAETNIGSQLLLFTFFAPMLYLVS